MVPSEVESGDADGVKRGLANVFSKRPDSKYFRF